MAQIKYEDLIKLIEQILEKGYGYSKDEAHITAWVLAEADARNIPSHGASRLDFYRKNLQGGFAKPGSMPKIVWETPCSLVIDGQDNVGCFVADWSVKKLIEKVKNIGSAYCAVRNSNHFGIAGLWAEEIAKNDMLGMAFTNTRACAIATNGKMRVLGTNPIAVAIPEKDGKQFLLDMATTTVAHGKVEVYDRRKKPMPLGWAVDENGKGTEDATAFEKLFYGNPLYGGHLFLGGEGEESGGHKGYGLGLLVELLCSGLSLGISSFNTFQKGQGSGITHFFAAFKLDLFGNPQEVKEHIGEILQDIRKGEKAEGQNRIYTHGEKEAESRAKSIKEGVYIDEPTWKLLESLKAEFKI
ncbi:MAG: Ldh family oxidoreductase [Elusimicrobiota bacterium]|jgi:LDH2 family malate/lactate/ureidoglycolate dehydrogenase|nr:Ldh family oxidoreductase [Elusimicrobiota bacterium]